MEDPTAKLYFGKQYNYEHTNNFYKFGCDRIINIEVIKENVISKQFPISTPKYATQKRNYML